MNTETICPGDEALEGLLLGKLTAEQEAAVVAHVEGCATCESRTQEIERRADPLLSALRGQAGGAAPAPEERTQVRGPPSYDPWPVLVEGYRVLEEIGRGGMGVVYRAYQRRLRRVVAIKMILTGRLAGGEELVRFRMEGALLARLSHPNFVQVYEVGAVEREGGALQPYLVLEHVDGGSLKDRMAAAPLPAREAAGLVLTLARAMETAHAQGIVHRDLKPANVLVARDGTLKIGDFGLARELGGASLTPAGLTVGTPLYMAPEQASGQAASAGPAADVYALGTILYEMLAGRPPFRRDTPMKVLAAVVQEAPEPLSRLRPGVPRDLATICAKCLEKEPHRRYATAQALADDLQCWLEGRPITARPVGRLERAWMWTRRNPAVALLLAAVLVLLGGGAGAFYWKYREAEAAARGEAQEKRAAQQARAEMEAERDRAEVALVRGMLRPFQASGGVLSIAEARALRDLRLLQNGRLRVLFVEQALARPEEAMQLHRRGADVGHALVGLDRDRAAQLAERVIARLCDADDPRIIDAGADLLPALWPRGDREPGAALVEALAGRLAAEKDAGAVRDLAGRLEALAPRLGEEEAAVAALALARRLGADETARPQLSAALVALAQRVGKAGAAEAAGPLARKIAGSSEPFAFDQLCPPLAALLARLPEQEAAELPRPAAATVTDLMFSGLHFPPFSLAPLLAELAVCMEEKDAEAAARAVARRLRDAAPRMKATTAAALLRLSGRLSKEKADLLLRPAVQDLAGHLGEWSGPPADLFVEMASRTRPGRSAPPPAACRRRAAAESWPT
jgi:hypothetical protein